MYKKILLFLTTIKASLLCAIQEEPYLQNIKQITFETMGFEKAGEGYFSPDGKRIIFQAVPKGETNFQIYTMSLEERVPKRVSTGKGSCTCANFRADGKKIIFASSHSNPNLEKEESQQTGKDGNYKWNFTPYMNIYEANVDGSELKALTTGIAYHAECSYSVDGTKIVYASNEDGSMNLYTMNSDGTNKEQLTFSENVYNGGPFFSPDGTRVIFRADPDKRDYLQIYTIDCATKEITSLTQNKFVNWAPYFHPSGEVIAYTTSRHGHHCYEIYLQNIHTKKEVRLTGSDSFDGLPVFNWKGDKIAWTSKRHGKSSQIFIADFTLPEELYEKN